MTLDAGECVFTSHARTGKETGVDLQPAMKKSIRIFGAAQPVSQTKLMAPVLQEALEKGINHE